MGLELVRRRRRRRSRPNRTKNRSRNFIKLPLSEILTVKMVTLAYKFASFFKGVPFEVIKGPGLRIRLFHSKWKRTLWYLSNVILYSSAIFQAISFPRVIAQQGLTTESALHIIYIMMYLFGVLFLASMLADELTFVCCINSMDSLERATKGEEWSKMKWYSSPFGNIAIIYLTAYSGSAYVLVWVCFFFMPTHSRYLFSLLPTNLQDKWLLMLLSGLFESMIWIWVGSMILIVFCYWVMVTFQQLFWLEEMCMEADACGFNSKRWRRLFGFYRALKCVNINHNSFSRSFLVGYYVNMVLLAVFFLYCSLETFDLVPLYVYFLFSMMGAFAVFLIVAFTPYTAKWEQKSGDFISISIAKLRTLRIRGEEYEALYKEARSLRPLRSEIGFFDTTTVETPRELMGQVIDHLLLLLTL